MLCWICELASTAFYLVVLYIVTRIGHFIWRNFIRKPYNLRERYGGEGVWACITGTTSGIGFGFCEELARQGFNILMVSRNESKLEEGKKELNSKYPNIKVEYVTADLSAPGCNSPQEKVAYFNKVGSQLNQYDIGLFINNASMGLVGIFSDLSPEKIKATIDSNTIPYALLLKEILPKLVKRTRSGIINVSSVASHWPAPASAIYSGTKAFNRTLSNSLAAEFNNIDIMALKPMGVQSNMYRIKAGVRGTISPRMCATGALRKLGHDIQTAGHWIHDMQQSILLSCLSIFGQKIIAKQIFKFTMKQIKKLQ